MLSFLCGLWPYLVGGLIGWLLAGWFARRLKFVEPPVEKIVEVEVEKHVDNPEHLSLISQLETNNNQLEMDNKKLNSDNSKIPELVTRIASLESSKPKAQVKGAGKVVEVDNPKHLARIKALEAENAQIVDLKSKLNIFETAKPKTVEVEKLIDNPDHLARIKTLEAENAKISDLEGKLKAFETAEPKVVEKEVEKLVDNPEHLARIKALETENARIADLEGKLKAFETAEPKVVETEVEKLVDNPEHLKRISLLEDEISNLKKGPKIDLEAARAAGIVIKNENDLTAIEGIGPKINDLIKADGVQTFAALSNTSPTTIQKALDNAGPSFKMANPGTWPDQANLAANNRWPALKALQDVLIGGVYPDGSNSARKSAAAASSTANKPKERARNVLKALDADAAKQFGFKVKQANGQDDFTIIEGVGPKINELIHEADIHTLTELGKTYVDDIQIILDKAGSSFSLAKPGTWPAQADMAASNRWEALKAWQDKLDGGKES